METACAPSTLAPDVNVREVAEVLLTPVPDVTNTKDRYPEDVFADDGCPNIEDYQQR